MSTRGTEILKICLLKRYKNSKDSYMKGTKRPNDRSTKGAEILNIGLQKVQIP